MFVPSTGDFGDADCGATDCTGVAEGCFTGTPVDVDRNAYHSASDETGVVFFNAAGALVTFGGVANWFACVPPDGELACTRLPSVCRARASYTLI
ncbi:hypothetical protein AB4Y45_45780 [Paraburkholderia sp. EG287A]|uniref:hypothetical protein n=1 Tax=Paraburkholderia sp. EG287A TaxID=3237012 RepID=UPI0034D2C1A5